MSVERLVASHLRLARAALTDAETLDASGSRNAVYMAEQAVEHLIYAVAQVEGVHFGRNQQHQLDTMIRALPDDGTYVPALTTLSWLEAYATTFRYPKTKGGLAQPPSAARLGTALSTASELLQRMASDFVVDLDPTAETPAVNVRPTR